MIETLSQILDEAYWALKSTDMVHAIFGLDAIKELAEECEEGLQQRIAEGSCEVKRLGARRRVGLNRWDDTTFGGRFDSVLPARSECADARKTPRHFRLATTDVE